MFIKPIKIDGANVVKDSFDEGDLTDGVHTVTATISGDNMGFGIMNNNDTNPLTFTIGTITIPVPISKSFYGTFVKDTTIVVAGTALDFDAFIEG